MRNKSAYIGLVILFVMLALFLLVFSGKEAALQLQPEDILVKAYLKDMESQSSIPNAKNYSRYIELTIDNAKKAPLATGDYTVRIYPVFSYSPLTARTFENTAKEDYSFGNDSVTLSLVKSEMEKAGLSEEGQGLSNRIGFTYTNHTYPATLRYFIPKGEHTPNPDNTFVIVTYRQGTKNLATWVKRVPLILPHDEAQKDGYPRIVRFKPSQ
ncbi:hypothetical protein ACTHPF_24445 [Paenibacillus sp. SAF-054]|uniref:hypothetical protein n=1 Tax=unclassified Paenibacillus TaxID=185978 RepID=UPI003F7F428E